MNEIDDARIDALEKSLGDLCDRLGSLTTDYVNLDKKVFALKMELQDPDDAMMTPRLLEKRLTFLEKKVFGKSLYEAMGELAKEMDSAGKSASVPEETKIDQDLYKIVNLKTGEIESELDPDEIHEVFIIFDGPPGHNGPRFIECQDADGKTISGGAWSPVPDEKKALPICPNSDCDYSGRSKRVEVDHDSGHDDTPYCAHCGTVIPYPDNLWQLHIEGPFAPASEYGPGVLEISVTEDHLVNINFPDPGPTGHMGFTPEEAEGLARSLMNKAREAREDRPPE